MTDSVDVQVGAHDLLIAARASRDRAMNYAEELRAGIENLARQHKEAVDAWVVERRALVQTIEEAGLELPKVEQPAQPAPPDPAPAGDVSG